MGLRNRMRSVAALMTALATASLGLAGVATVATPGIANAATGTAMYRLYNPVTGEHFYTRDLHEATVQVASGAWNSEGIGWYAPPEGEGAPVYRLGAKVGTGSAGHLFTTSKEEIDSAMATGQWNDEGIGWYSKGTVSIFRQNNPATGQHNYTADLNEIKVITTEQGWVEELVVDGKATPAWLGLGPGDPGDQTVADAVKQYKEEQAKVFAPFESTTCTSAGTGPDPSAATSIITANVALTGSGAGYQGKVRLNDTSGNAVSFGIQYDEAAVGGPAFNNQPAFMTENVSNSANIHNYKDWCIGALDRPERVTIAYFDSAHIVAFYVANVFIGQQSTNLTGQIIYGLEANVKYNGNTVKAAFTGVTSGGAHPIMEWAHWWWLVDANGGGTAAPGFNMVGSTDAANQTFTITGTGTVFGPGQDWDSNPFASSGVVMIQAR